MFAPVSGTTVALVSTMVYHAIKELDTGSLIRVKFEGQEHVDSRLLIPSDCLPASARISLIAIHGSPVP